MQKRQHMHQNNKIQYKIRMKCIHLIHSLNSNPLQGYIVNVADMLIKLNQTNVIMKRENK